MGRFLEEVASKLGLKESIILLNRKLARTVCFKEKARAKKQKWNIVKHLQNSLVLPQSKRGAAMEKSR